MQIHMWTYFALKPPMYILHTYYVPAYIIQPIYLQFSILGDYETTLLIQNPYILIYILTYVVCILQILVKLMMIKEKILTDFIFVPKIVWQRRKLEAEYSQTKTRLKSSQKALFLAVFSSVCEFCTQTSRITLTETTRHFRQQYQRSKGF